MDATTTVVDAARRALGPVGAFLPVQVNWSRWVLAQLR